MRAAHDDLEHRWPVWEALSSLFLDIDTSLSHTWRVRILATSPYSIDEMQQILTDEVYPVCRWNLFCIAGEWDRFDPAWVQSSILRRLRSPFYRFRRFSLGRLTVQFSSEWRTPRKVYYKCALKSMQRTSPNELASALTGGGKMGGVDTMK